VEVGARGGHRPATASCEQQDPRRERTRLPAFQEPSDGSHQIGITTPSALTCVQRKTQNAPFGRGLRTDADEKIADPNGGSLRVAIPDTITEHDDSQWEDLAPLRVIPYLESLPAGGVPTTAAARRNPRTRRVGFGWKADFVNTHIRSAWRSCPAARRAEPPR
jgi:hypothetical protein